MATPYDYSTSINQIADLSSRNEAAYTSRQDASLAAEVARQRRARKRAERKQSGWKNILKRLAGKVAERGLSAAGAAAGNALAPGIGGEIGAGFGADIGGSVNELLSGAPSAGTGFSTGQAVAGYLNRQAAPVNYGYNGGGLSLEELQRMYGPGYGGHR